MLTFINNKIYNTLYVDIEAVYTWILRYRTRPGCTSKANFKGCINTNSDSNAAAKSCVAMSANRIKKTGGRQENEYRKPAFYNTNTNY